MNSFVKGIAVVLGGFLVSTAVFAQGADTLVWGIAQNRTTTNGSATITTGNTFQQVLAVLSSGQRQSLTIQNNNASDSCWVFIGAGSATKATSILLATGQAYTRYWPYVPTDEIQATCASNSDTLYIDTQ